MKLKKQIKVMKAALQGAEIKMRPKSGEGEWEIAIWPTWNWEEMEYKIAKRYSWVYRNPAGQTYVTEGAYITADEVIAAIGKACTLIGRLNQDLTYPIQSHDFAATPQNQINYKTKGEVKMDWIKYDEGDKRVVPAMPYVYHEEGEGWVLGYMPRYEDIQIISKVWKCDEYWEWCNEAGDFFEPKEVTHWMPLPAAPKQEEK